MSTEHAPSLTCGACKLCCKLIAVEELAKKQDQWCPHVNKLGEHGCQIFGAPARPAACSDWQCVWLQSQSNADPRDRLPPELRPDRTHVVLAPGLDHGRTLLVHVDPVYPNAWKEGKIGDFVDRVIKRTDTPVVIVRGDRRTGFLEPKQVDGVRELVPEFTHKGK